MKLLTVGNPKIAKGEKLGYLTAILHLAPHTMSGWNVCPMATAGCSAACLNTAGRGGMFAGCKTKNLTGSEMVQDILDGKLINHIQNARLNRTQMFFENRVGFFSLLVKEIETVIRLADRNGLTPVFRLNGTSDLRWETYPVTVNGILYPNIMSAFRGYQFYDYTKIPNRRNLPRNYHLTFSLADGNELNAWVAIENGMNVAVVFRTKEFPTVFMTLSVINGDEHDLRFLDPRGSIVALKAKGKAKKDITGFVKDVS